MPPGQSIQLCSPSNVAKFYSAIFQSPTYLFLGVGSLLVWLHVELHLRYDLPGKERSTSHPKFDAMLPVRPSAAVETRQLPDKACLEGVRVVSSATKLDHFPPNP